MTRTTRPLGTTGMAFTCVGLGTSPWLAVFDDSEVVTAIHRALDVGVNWIDTAALYGFGRSEELIARTLATRSPEDQPYLVTKCGFEWDESIDPLDPHVHYRSTPESVRRGLEGSLRRLGRDQIDLFLIHHPPQDPPTPIEEYWQTMLDLRAEGKVRAIGLSNHDVGLLERAEAIGHVDAIQPAFSAIRRKAATEIAWSAEHGTGVIVYSPLQSGLLAGSFTAERAHALPADDWRRAYPEFTTGLDANLALAEALIPIAERHEVTRAAVAIAWTLAWPGMTSAIAGASRPEQVDDWLAGCDLQLTEADLDEIAAAIERTGAGEGPARPPTPRPS